MEISAIIRFAVGDFAIQNSGFANDNLLRLGCFELTKTTSLMDLRSRTSVEDLRQI